MAKQHHIAAIDLGTDKCATLIASVDEDSSLLRVVGLSVVPSKGIRKSTIVDLEQALSSLTESLDAAERMAGAPVSSAVVSISGSHIASQNSRGVVAVAAPNQEITRDDVDRVIEAARAVSLPNDKRIIHVIPKDFKIDTQTGIKDPVGMTGIRLESEAHIITGMVTQLRNVEKCVHDAGLAITSFCFSGLASSYVVTTETERELGVVVVDIGAGSTTVCAFVEGALEFSTALPIGARHITQDIALGCRISLEAAEKIKLHLSEEEASELAANPGESKEEYQKRRKKADIFNPSSIGIPEDIGELSKKTLIQGIMAPRMKEIITLVGEELASQNIHTMVPAGLVLTGGGAETVAMTEVAKRTLRLPARIGKPTQLQGLTADLLKPSFATSIGLLQYGKQYIASPSSSVNIDLGNVIKHLPITPLKNKFSDLLKSVMP